MSDLFEKNLNRWFKEKWVDVSRKDKDGKHPPCGRSKAKKGSKGYPKCRPSVKVSSKTPKTSGSMSEGEKRAATKRKRSKKQGVGGKPTVVKSTDVAFGQAWDLLKTRDPAAEGRPHSTFDLMNITPGKPYTTPAEEDIRRFTEKNPDIKRTHKYREFDHRFPYYRKPLRFGPVKRGDTRTTHHYVGEDGKPDEPMEWDEDLGLGNQLAIARREDVWKPHHERRYMERALPKGHKAGSWTRLPAIHEGEHGVRGQPGGTYWAHRGAEDDEQPQEMPEWFDDSEYKLTGEPMDAAWSSLTKAKKKKKSKPFHGYNPKKHHRKGGLNAKGRAKAKREEGANIKPPVTTKPSKLKAGSKKAKRRKSFCARMTGVKGPTSKKGKLTPKGAALKRWNC